MAIIKVNKIIESDFKSPLDLVNILNNDGSSNIVIAVVWGEKIGVIERKRIIKNKCGYRVNIGYAEKMGYFLESTANAPSDFLNHQMICSTGFNIELV